MNKGTIRILSLVACVGILICIAFIIKINNIVYYTILSAGVIQGVKTILDYFLGFPMQVGYSGSYPKTKGNEDLRVMLLILGVALAFFAIWWIFFKGV